MLRVETGHMLAFAVVIHIQQHVVLKLVGITLQLPHYHLPLFRLAESKIAWLVLYPIFSVVKPLCVIRFTEAQTTWFARTFPTTTLDELRNSSDVSVRVVIFRGSPNANVNKNSTW